jgi:glycosyltransferase involved in cell wall biosynthesis
VIFNIIGSGPEESRLKAIAGDAELGKSVVFLGDQSTKEVVHWMARADIFLFPSVRLDTGEVDTQGLALQEAQAMRLPVVASEVGGVPYGLVPGESGFLVRPEDQADLAEKIEHLAARPELRAKMGAAGRAFVCENFSPARFNRIHWRTYREMLNPAGGAG